MSTSPSEHHTSKYFVYLGTYERGIYAYRFDLDGPKLENLGLVGELRNPSFLASDPQHRSVYAVSELEGEEIGAVAAFQVNRASGHLKLLSSASSGGIAPCHLMADHTSKLLFVANYGSGSLSAFPIEPAGEIGPICALLPMEGSSVNRQRQQSPHAHEAVVSKNNRYVYVPDLGSDQVRIYRINPERKTVVANEPGAVKVSPGLGPRHIAFSPDDRFAYLVNELKSMVTVFAHDADSAMLRPIQALSTLPEGTGDQDGAAEILVHSSGRFVYASNRGPGTVAVFAIDPASGMLSQIQMAETGGTSPRGMEFDPTGQLLFIGDQKANRFVVFRCDPNTGHLQPTGQIFDCPSPVSFLFIPV